MKTKICAALAMTAIIGFSSISVYADDEIGDGCPDVDDSDVIGLDETIEYDDGRLLHVDFEDYNNHRSYCHDEEGNILYLDWDDNGKEHYLIEAENTGTVYIDLDDYDRDGKSVIDSEGWILFYVDYVDDNGAVHCHDRDFNIFYIDSSGYVHQLVEAGSDTEDKTAADEDTGANDYDEPIAGNENEDTGTDTNKSKPAEPNPKTGNNGFPAAAVTACALAAAALLKAKENLK